MSEESKQSMLQSEARAMREGMLGSSRGLERHPNIQHALAMYDEQMDKLSAATDTEAARRMYAALISAKDAFLNALHGLQQTPTAQAVTDRTQELSSSVQESVKNAGGD